VSRTDQRARARSIKGFAVDVEVGGFTVAADMPVSAGGDGAAPRPEDLMRAGFAASLVIGYVAWGDRLGTPIADVRVDVTTETDPAGWQSMRWHVNVTSTASEADVERVLAHAERVSPMLDCLNPRCERLRTFEVRRPG
jgi:uncharacterized OsmC-like protein